MESEFFWKWLIEQLPVVVVMGVVLYFLFKMYREKDEQVAILSQKTIELATLWERRSDEQDDAQFKKEVLECLNDLKNNKCLAERK